MYNKVNWINEDEGTTTPLNAENLNTMDDGIANLDERVTELEESSGGSNAFAHIKVGNKTINATGADTFELVAGSNVSMGVDEENKKITLNSIGGGGGSTAIDNDTIIYNESGEIKVSDDITDKLGGWITTSDIATSTGTNNISFNIEDTTRAYKLFFESANNGFVYQKAVFVSGTSVMYTVEIPEETAVPVSFKLRMI